MLKERSIEPTPRAKGPWWLALFSAVRERRAERRKAERDRGLLAAAQTGNANAARSALAAGADPQARGVDERGRTRSALSFAASAGCFELVELLLARGAAPDSAAAEEASRAGDERSLVAIVSAIGSEAWADKGAGEQALSWAGAHGWAAGLDAILPLAPDAAIERWLSRRESRRGRAHAVSTWEEGGTKLGWEQTEERVRSERSRREAEEIAEAVSQAAPPVASSDAARPAPRRL